MEMKGAGPLHGRETTYECWKRRRQRAQRKSLSEKPTSPHMEHTVVLVDIEDGDTCFARVVDWMSLNYHRDERRKRCV
jgi:hypothetical protein